MAVFGFCYVTRRYGFLEKRDIWRDGMRGGSPL